MRLQIKEARKYLKVGTRIRTNGSGNSTIERSHGDEIRCGLPSRLEGIIGEINGSTMYIGQNTHDGSRGSKSVRRYNYSWAVDIDNRYAWIEILDEIKIEVKVYGIVNFCKKHYE